MELLGYLVVCALLGCIPGAIAQSKGRSFAGWWFYGFMIFIVALIHSLLIKPREPAVKPAISPAPVAPLASAAEEIRRFAALRDDGVISSAEFETKKAQLLG